MEDHSIKTEINDAISNGSDIVFISYSMLDSTEENIKFALSKILEKYKREEWFTPILSCIRELTSNALKANAKQILTDEGSIKETDDIIEIVRKLRTILNKKSLLEYGIKTKLKSLSTRIYFKMLPERLIIQVINNLPITQKDLQRIHERIESSSEYDSIADFYMNHPDPAAEGMGLGLSMVVTILKSIEINYKNFTLTTDGKGKTYAQIEIPFN